MDEYGSITIRDIKTGEKEDEIQLKVSHINFAFPLSLFPSKTLTNNQMNENEIFIDQRPKLVFVNPFTDKISDMIQDNLPAPG